jgi:NitT/TauT family transport system substrate-binding protein
MKVLRTGKIVSLWLCLSTLGFLASSSAAAQAAEKTAAIKLHLPGYSTSSLPFLIADDLGFYRDEGVRIETTRIRTGAGIQALIAGVLDASQIVGPTVLAAVLGGAPLKVVMVFNDKPTYKLYVKRRFKSFADLRAAKIGSSTPGSTNDRLLKVVLEKNGIDWRKDLTVIYIGSSDIVLKALQAGSIDGAALTPPASFLAEEYGFHSLASFSNEIGALQGGVSTSVSFLQSHRGLAERFLRATLKGLRTFKSDRDGTIKVMAKYLELSEDKAGRIYDETSSAFVSNGYLSDEFQDKVLDFELETIGTDKKLTRDKLFEFSLIKSLATK